MRCGLKLLVQNSSSLLRSPCYCRQYRRSETLG
ncbi:hypothetical protein [Escherichia phage PH1061]|nr:hypothetical protein [Escherichia phage PH1061]